MRGSAGCPSSHHKASNFTAMENRKSIRGADFSCFDLLSEDIVLIILDFLNENSVDRKSFSLVCRSFYAIESRHRSHLKPLRSEFLEKVLIRYPNVSKLDLSLFPRVTYALLDVGLSNLVNCGNLVGINLSNATKLQDSAVEAIAEAKNLEKLLLVSCKSITDIGIGYIAAGCRKLKVLSLKCCSGVGDLGVGLIADNCRDIRWLDLSFLPITNKCLARILELQHLENLDLEGCSGINDDSFAAPKQGCKSLKKLDMSFCQRVGHVGMSSLTSAAPNLQQLLFSYMPFDLARVENLQKLSDLQTIKLEGCTLAPSAINAIANYCVSLRELSLNKCIGVGDQGVSSIVTKCTDLRKLDISGLPITHVSLARITSSCTSLVSLKMVHCNRVIAGAFVSIGQRCPLLEELDLSFNRIGDKVLKSISRCSELKSLKLGSCWNITDKGLLNIAMCCSKLKQLELYRSDGVTDSSISAIAHNCPGLEMINIAYCISITDSSLMALSNCCKLNALECPGCQLITPVGLTTVAIACKQLSRLDIKMCPNIDDAAMIHLAHLCRNLKQINLSYTSVTDVGLLSVASISSLRSIAVIHLAGLTPGGLAAALSACVRLTYVKLQASFQYMLPKPLLENMKACGCTFQWSERLFWEEKAKDMRRRNLRRQVRVIGRR